MTTPDNKLIGEHIPVGMSHLGRTGEATRQGRLHGHIAGIGRHTIVFERGRRRRIPTWPIANPLL